MDDDLKRYELRELFVYSVLKKPNKEIWSKVGSAHYLPHDEGIEIKLNPGILKVGGRIVITSQNLVQSISSVEVPPLYPPKPKLRLVEP